MKDKLSTDEQDFFTYHNSAESYYVSRGFRGKVVF